MEFFKELARPRFLDPGVLPCVLDAFLHATGHATLTPQLAADFVRFCAGVLWGEAGKCQQTKRAEGGRERARDLDSLMIVSNSGRLI